MGAPATDGRLRALVERGRRLLPRPATVASVVGVLLAWQAFSTLFPAYQFPGLVGLAGRVATVLSGAGEFDSATNYGATFLRVAVGFTLSFALATVWGVALGVRPVVEDYLSAPLFVLLTVPSVVWAFLGVLWFGLTDHLVPVFVVVLIVVPYLGVTVWEGVRAVDRDLLEMAAAFDASPLERWRHVYLPQVLPTLFATARIGLALSWKLALVAEVFGAATGVGVAMKFHFENFTTGMVIAWAVPVMAVMAGVEYALRRAETRATRWRPEPATGREVAPE
jgi:NitT/TauT family transport system permease protein